MSTSNGSFGNISNIGISYLKRMYSLTLASATDTQLGGFTTKITPTSSSNKVLCLCSFSGYQPQQSGLTFARGGVNLSAASSAGSRNVAHTTDASHVSTSNACCTFMAYLDSPATTSVTTYSVLANNQAVAININEIGASTAHSGSSYMILLEI
jgi:hypothetical protein